MLAARATTQSKSLAKTRNRMIAPKTSQDALNITRAQNQRQNTLQNRLNGDGFECARNVNCPTKCKHIGTRPPAGIGSLRDCGVVHLGKIAEQCTLKHSWSTTCPYHIGRKTYCSYMLKSKLPHKKRNPRTCP